MLQQTQSATVIPYFNRWMELFPTVQDLAKAPLDEVLKVWEGLGYYSRAKNLHEGAKTINVFPNTESELLKIKGIGPYTSKAILSFAFGQKVAPVDGNVNRVISRLFGLYDLKKVQESADSLLPEKQPEILAEALIELGATVCQKKPRCEICPVQKQCRAFEHDLQSELPPAKKREKTIHLRRMVAVITYEDYLLIRKNEKGKVMEHLLEFPYLEETTIHELQKNFIELNLSLEKTLSEQSHTFTKYRAHLTPYLFTAEKKVELEGYQWLLKEELKKRPFSAGHRKIVEEYYEIDTH